MKKLLTAAVAVSLALFVLPALAITPDQTILKAVHDSIITASSKVLPMAISWLGAFMGLQFVLTNFALLKSGADIEAVFGKLIGSVIWFGFCIYLMNEGPGFIDSVGNYVHNQMAATVPTPSSIINSTLGVCVAILTAIAVVGTSVIGIGNQAVAMFLVYVLFGVLAIGVYMAVKIAMLYLELGLIVALAPLSFSFLGLNALKDQGIAPLKSLIALVYRMILLGILGGAFDVIVQGLGAAFKNMSWDPTSMGDAAKALLEAVCAFPFLAFLVYKSDAIAASLAGGGSSLGAADVASAAAAGAAAGAAIGSAGTGAMGALSKIPQSMSSVLGNMMGGGGGDSAAMRNASTSATGAGSTSAAKPQAVKPTFPTNKAGAPQPRDFQAGANAAPNSSFAQPAQAAEDAKSAESFASGLSSTASSNAMAGTTASTSGTPSSTPVGNAPERSTSGTTTAEKTDSGSSSSSAQRSGPAGTAPSKATPSASGSPSGASTGPASTKPIPSHSSSQTSTPVGTPPAKSAPSASGGSSAAPTSAAPAKPVPSASGAQSADPVATAPVSGQGASIGGTGSLPPRKTVRENFDEANRHLASEKATTSISISTHNTD